MKNEFKIGPFVLGEDHPPFVIAEIGINHEGSFEKAKRMVFDASQSGASCVKFQRHVIDDEMVPEAKKTIPGNADVSIWEIMNRCVLSLDEHRRLKEYAESLGMIYLCTPFSRKAADELESLGVLAYKIGSGECNNYPLVEHIASFGKPIILSTGMNDIKSVSLAVEIMESKKVPYAILQCTSMYPTPYEKVGLGAIPDLQNNFPNAVIGLSDHSLGIYPCLGAVALGCRILEKHFISDKSWPGPDVEISIDPLELSELIKGSKIIWSARSGSKEILSEEQPTIDFAYACVVSIKNISKGEKLSKENIWVKRPGTGDILAKDYSSLLGKVAKNNISSDSQLRWSDFE